MAIANSTVLLVGSGTADESATPVAIASGASNAPTTVDLLGDDTSAGDVELYLILTSTVTAGSVQVRFNPQRRLNAGTPDYAKLSYEYTITPTNGSQLIPLGRRPCPRFASVDVFNNATGASCSVAILGKVTKLS